MAALQDFSPLVEPASIDEAYLDATGLERLFGPVEQLIPAIKARVREVTGGLTCSVGAAPVKFLAKICSDINKPDGIYILRPDDVDSFLGGLDVRRLPGVGRRMVAELEAPGSAGGPGHRPERGTAVSANAPKVMPGPGFWNTKWGRELHARARGIDPRPVVPEHEAKSESAETTFARDTRDREFLKTMLLGHAERVGASLRRHGLRGRTVTLKVKFADFRQITRSRTLPEATDSTETIYETGTALLEAEALPQPVRLIGLGVSGFGNAPTQELLPGVFRGVQGRDPEQEARRRRLDAALDNLRGKFGKQAVQRGACSAHAMMARMIRMMF